MGWWDFDDYDQEELGCFWFAYLHLQNIWWCQEQCFYDTLVPPCFCTGWRELSSSELCAQGHTGRCLVIRIIIVKITIIVIILILWIRSEHWCSILIDVDDGDEYGDCDDFEAGSNTKDPFKSPNNQLKDSGQEGTVAGWHL